MSVKPWHHRISQHVDSQSAMLGEIYELRSELTRLTAPKAETPQVKKYAKTTWFPGNMKPVHVGVYERNHKLSGKALFQFWNGKYFGLLANAPDQAVNGKFRKSWLQKQKPWRGLAVKP